MSLNLEAILELLKQHVSLAAQRVPKGWEIIAREAHRQGVIDGRAIQMEKSGGPYLAAGESEGQAFDTWLVAQVSAGWLYSSDEEAARHAWDARSAEIAALRERIAALEARETRADPVGDWLWHELMDYCRERGIPPAQSNRLFEIVTRARGRWDSSSGA